MKQDYWETVYARMKRDESNDFIYRKWFGKDGFENFKSDIKEFPSRKHLVGKIDNTQPFSPTNFKWILKPKMVFTHRSATYKQKMEYQCYTLKFIISEHSNLNKSGVYKITFDNGRFYIGSTINFKKRINCFVGSFRGSTPMHNKQIIKCVLGCNEVVFEVVKYIDEVSSLKDEETLEINKHLENDLLLNRAHDACSNRGIRWTKEERDKTKQSLIAKFKSGELKAGTHSRGKRGFARKGKFESKIL